MIAPARTHFEDVALDAVLETPAMTITEAHVGLYTGLVHELVEPGTVPDYLPLCLTTGLGWRAPPPPLVVLAFMGFEWQTLGPVRVGDTIHSRSRTVTKRPLREGGVIIEVREVINQRGEVVEQGRFTFLVGRRPAPGEGETEPGHSSARPPTVQAGLADPAPTEPARVSLGPPTAQAGLADPAPTEAPA